MRSWILVAGLSIATVAGGCMASDGASDRECAAETAEPPCDSTGTTRPLDGVYRPPQDGSAEASPTTIAKQSSACSFARAGGLADALPILASLLVTCRRRRRTIA